MQHKEFGNSFIDHNAAFGGENASAETSELFDALLSGCREHYSIPASAFTNYNVKRGLRNPAPALWRESPKSVTRTAT